jgi:hypothetical protein
MSKAHGTEAAGHIDHHDGRPQRFTRWLTTTNHKDIGTMYLVFSLVMFLIGGVMALLIRAELSARRVGFRPSLPLRPRICFLDNLA